MKYNHRELCEIGEILYKEFTIKPYIHNEYDDEYEIIIMYKVSGVLNK